MSKITGKLPRTDELTEMLRELPPQMAGLVLQSVLAYELGEDYSMLPDRAAAVRAEWVKLINLSRARATAGRVGSENKHKNLVCHQQIIFATNKTPEPPAQDDLDGFDVLEGLEAFM